MSGIVIGCKLLESVNWELGDSAARMIAMLILLSSKMIQGVNPEWLHDMLLGPSSTSLGIRLLKGITNDVSYTSIHFFQDLMILTSWKDF